MKGPDGISRRGLFSLRVPLWGMFGATVTAVDPGWRLPAGWRCGRCRGASGVRHSLTGFGRLAGIGGVGVRGWALVRAGSCGGFLRAGHVWATPDRLVARLWVDACGPARSGGLSVGTVGRRGLEAGTGLRAGRRSWGRESAGRVKGPGQAAGYTAGVGRPRWLAGWAGGWNQLPGEWPGLAAEVVPLDCSVGALWRTPCPRDARCAVPPQCRLLGRHYRCAASHLPDTVARFAMT